MNIPDFHFMGRCELFEKHSYPNMDSILHRIFCHKLDNPNVFQVMGNVTTWYYRRGFARGCRAGADDVIRFLKENPEYLSIEGITLIGRQTLDASRKMEDCIPFYQAQNQDVKTDFTKK